jgi:hypothetical protein
MHLIGPCLIGFIGIMNLTSCAYYTCYSTTLINDRGEVTTCEAKDKNCSVAGSRNYEECVSAATARGFREIPHHSYQEYSK